MTEAEFPKSEQVDIMLFSEGTYPYVKGGVSSWILQLIKGVPEYTFGVVFVGASEYVDGKKMEVGYEIPKNLIHLEVHYMFDSDEKTKGKRIPGSKEGLESIKKLYQSFQEGARDIPERLKNIDFYSKEVTFDDFLHSERSWNFIAQTYEKNCPDIPFVDYFWALRNMHKPIWILADIVKNMPKAKMLHSPSTGYAGFMAALASYTRNTPFILTEHGIYTRERKIDMLSADWIEFQRPKLLQPPEEYNYIKKMWVDFFDKFGVFCYNRANHILSLFAGARRIQIAYGADETRTMVIPNGVDVDGLKATMQYRNDPPKKIITLIGRVVPIKDIKTFIRAIKITKEHIPDVEGWLVGPVDEDEEYVKECQQMAISLGLKKEAQKFVNGNHTEIPHDELEKHPDTLKLFGFSNIKEILPKSALQALSSISEGMPLVILEGFAAGVPCVATDVGSCRDLIEGGVNDDDIALGHAGAICGIADPEALAQQYIRFLTYENGEWEKAQKIALERVEMFYRQEMFLKDYKELYDEACDLSWEELQERIVPYYNPKNMVAPKSMIKRFPIKKFVVKEKKE